jgi:hypothetical protein
MGRPRTVVAKARAVYLVVSMVALATWSLKLAKMVLTRTYAGDATQVAIAGLGKEHSYGFDGSISHTHLNR